MQIDSHAPYDKPATSASKWHAERGTGWPSLAGDSTPSPARADERPPPHLTYLLLLGGFTLATLIDIVWLVDGVFLVGQLFAFTLSVMLIVDVFRRRHARMLGVAYVGVLGVGLAVNLAMPEFPDSGPWWFFASDALSALFLFLSALIVDRRGFVWRYAAIGCLAFVPAGILLSEFVAGWEHATFEWWGEFRLWVTVPMSVAMMVAVWAQWRAGRKDNPRKPMGEAGR